MHKCERAAREKLAGLEHGKGWESLGFWFIAPAALDKAAASACLSPPLCAGIGWISPQTEEQIYL